MPKTLLDVNKIRELKRQINEVNMLLLDDCEFVEDGKPVTICPKVLEEWRFTGMNNVDFVTSGAYQQQDVLFDPVEQDKILTKI